MEDRKIVNSMQELLNLVQALTLAVDRNLMKREHAGAMWKKILTISGIDMTKKEVRKKDGIS